MNNVCDTDCLMSELLDSNDSKWESLEGLIDFKIMLPCEITDNKNRDIVILLKAKDGLQFSKICVIVNSYFLDSEFRSQESFILYDINERPSVVTLCKLLTELEFPYNRNIISFDNLGIKLEEAISKNGNNIRPLRKLEF